MLSVIPRLDGCRGPNVGAGRAFLESEAQPSAAAPAECAHADSTLFLRFEGNGQRNGTKGPISGMKSWGVSRLARLAYLRSSVVHRAVEHTVETEQPRLFIEFVLVLGALWHLDDDRKCRLDELVVYVTVVPRMHALPKYYSWLLGRSGFGRAPPD